MQRRCLRLSVMIGLVVVAATSCGFAAEKQPSAEQIKFFETKIRPVLANRCYKCHGPKKQQNQLRLDSLKAMLQGGELGPAIVPGQPKRSLLITAIGYRDDDLQMPPNKKLSDRQIEDLTLWVKMGAPFPTGDSPARVAKQIDVEQGRQFWSFQPPVDSRVPIVKDRTWPNSSLDHFVLAALQAKGLKPAPAADKRTLIRRATFDLIGLPPTLDEIEAFVSDDSVDAFVKVVDRLLASPQYGQRWGRHWLDVARYADSNGLDENVAHGNAWRYRDYVVDSLNSDKPYDQFLMEQLAGDLLPGENGSRHQRLIATGFLSLGPKVLAEVDEKKMEMDIVDEQIDTVGRAFLGLTLGCARCHDHQFDPIPTEDYYSLAGIFKSTRTMENFKKVAKWHENSLATKADLARKSAHDKQVAAQKQAIAQLMDEANQRLKSKAKPDSKLPKNPESLYPKQTKAKLKRLRDQLAELEKLAPVMPSAMGVTEGNVADSPVHVRGNPLSLGDVVPRGFPQVLADRTRIRPGAKQSGRLELARWLVEKDHPLTSRVMVNRIWRWHFGRGLVPTPDNFGNLGERPTNQPLLDWLAHRFIENGWSVKAMHRLIMLSSTYQMSSRFDAKSAAIDPENRLGWRTDVRRLEAEAIRDALLAVGGLLDLTMGGSLLHVKNREYFFNHTSQDGTRYDSRRRSIYLPVVRNHLYDVFQLFDYSDASVMNGNRPTSTVAPQALFMMNGDLVAEVTQRMAEELLRRQDLDNAGRIRLLYRQTYGRPPTPKELDRADSFVDRFQRVTQTKDAEADKHRLRTWQALCQVVVAGNEFLYVK